jgi:hypothetical protein
MHELNESTKRLTEFGSFLFAGISGVLTLANAALIVSIVAGLVSAVLGLVRIYDRVKYGRQAT